MLGVDVASLVEGKVVARCDRALPVDSEAVVVRRVDETTESVGRSAAKRSSSLVFLNEKYRLDFGYLKRYEGFAYLWVEVVVVVGSTRIGAVSVLVHSELKTLVVATGGCWASFHSCRWSCDLGLDRCSDRSCHRICRACARYGVGPSRHILRS